MFKIDPNAPVITNKKIKLTRLAEISTILGLFISLFGLVIATYYAIKTYDLSIETSNNRDQLDRLDRLIRLNTESIKNLTEVAIELKVQNGKLTEVNNNLIESFIESRNQSKILSDELKISISEQKRTNENYYVKQKTDSIQFYYSVFNLTTEYNPKNYLSYDSIMQSKYITRVKSIIEEEMQNPFLLLDDSLYLKWKSVNDFIDLWQKEFIYGNYFGFVEIKDSSGNLVQLRGLEAW